MKTLGNLCLVLLLSVVAMPASALESAFGENYTTVEIIKNQPFSSSQDRFSTGSATAMVGFRHITGGNWLMGVHLGFKQFEDKVLDQETNIFTFLQESKYMVRLYHPVYFAIGPRLLYLLPTKGRKIPPEPEKKFRREIGAALSVDLIYNLNRQFLVTLRVDRWRGVNTEVFQGSETALGLNYMLP